MRINVAPLVASILIAEDLRDSSVMQQGARNGQPEAVHFAKGRGLCFSSMPELAKNQSVPYRDAGINTRPARTTPFYVPTYIRSV